MKEQIERQLVEDHSSTEIMQHSGSGKHSTSSRARLPAQSPPTEDKAAFHGGSPLGQMSGPGAESKYPYTN
jgi:hypothetical protein